MVVEVRCNDDGWFPERKSKLNRARAKRKKKNRMVRFLGVGYARRVYIVVHGAVVVIIIIIAATAISTACYYCRRVVHLSRLRSRSLSLSHHSGPCSGSFRACHCLFQLRAPFKRFSKRFSFLPSPFHFCSVTWGHITWATIMK